MTDFAPPEVDTFEKIVQGTKGRILFGVPKKGLLHAHVVKILHGAGLDFTRLPRLDLAHCTRLPITLVFLPAVDIAGYVGAGKVDLGMTGAHVVEESRVEDHIDVIAKLGFGVSRMCVQAPVGTVKDVKDLCGKRVVTSFPVITRRYFKELNPELETRTRYVSGSVEAACSLGLADAVVDLVHSGTTMMSAGLEIVSTIMESECVLLCKKVVTHTHPHEHHEHHGHSHQAQHQDGHGHGHQHKHTHTASAETQAMVVKVCKRIEGYLKATEYAMVKYNIPTNRLSEAVKITGGDEMPTIKTLNQADWVAVSALIKASEVSEIMDELTAVGARSILISQADNCRYPGKEETEGEVKRKKQKI